MNANHVLVTQPLRSASNCLHSRMLENICDTYGKKTDTLRCCECGAFVVIHSQHLSVS